MIEITPEVGFVAGAAVGTMLDIVAQRKVAREDQAFAEVLGEAQTGHSRWDRVSTVVTWLALTGGMVGAVNAIAWEPTPGPEVTPPHVELVVDHSGATVADHNKPLEGINKVVAALETHDLEINAVIASGGEVSQGNLDTVADDAPFGDAPLDQAMQTALDNESALRDKSATDTQKRSIGTLAIVNGNTIGVPTDTIAKAQALGSPIYVVNVEAQGADPGTVEQLQQIAKETGGKYWDASADNAKAVAKEVKGDLTSNIQKSPGTKGNLAEKVMGAAGVVGLVAAFVKRRNQARDPNRNIVLTGRK